MIAPARITAEDRIATPTAPTTTPTPAMNISAHAAGVPPWFACGAAGGGSDLGTCGYGGGLDMSCFLHRSVVLGLSLRGRPPGRGSRTEMGRASCRGGVWTAGSGLRV